MSVLASFSKALKVKYQDLEVGIDFVPEEQLGSQIMAMHNVSQGKPPITMVAAGLPQLLGLAGRAKSYAECLFEFVAIDRLNNDAARAALVMPAAKGVSTFSLALLPKF